MSFGLKFQEVYKPTYCNIYKTDSKIIKNIAERFFSHEHSKHSTVSVCNRFDFHLFFYIRPTQMGRCFRLNVLERTHGDAIIVL